MPTNVKASQTTIVLILLSKGEELDNEGWNEMIEGCVDGDESIRYFCVCLIEQISNDYTIESMMSMNSAQIEQLGLDYSI